MGGVNPESISAGLPGTVTDLPLWLCPAVLYLSPNQPLGDLGVLIVCNGMFRSGSTLQYNLTRSLVEHLNVGEGKGWFRPEQLADMQSQFAEWQASDRLYVIKSHTMLPNSAKLQAAGQIQICYTYRDARDVAVSIKRKFKEEGDNLYKLLDKSIATYFTMKEIDGAIWQKYENMMADLPGEVRHLAQGLGLTPSDSLVTAIAQEWSLDSTRKVIQQFDRKRRIKAKLHTILSKLKIEKPVTATIRKVNPEFKWGAILDRNNLLHADHISEQGGRVGGWQTELTPDEIQTVTERYYDYLIDAGYLMGATVESC